MFRILLILLSAASLAVAGEIRVTPESAGSYAVRHHPGLAAARLKVAEARGRLRQAGRMPNPEVELGFSRNVDKPEGGGSGFVQQRFPITARLRLEKAVSRSALAAAEAEVQNEERKLRADAATLAVKILAVEAQRALRQQQLSNSRELGDFTRRRREAGEASDLDLAQVQIETQQLKIEQLQLEAERAALVGELRPLFGCSPGTAILVSGQLSPPASVPHRALVLRPDLIAAQNNAEAARQTAALARAQRWSDVAVGVGVERERTEDVPEGFDGDTSVGVRLSVPLPLWDRGEGRIEETAAAAERARQEAAALGLTIQSEAASAREQMQAFAAVSKALDETLLPQARALEEQFRVAYGEGLSALPEVLGARDKRLQLQRQRLDALRDYHLARIRYQSATATSP